MIEVYKILEVVGRMNSENGAVTLQISQLKPGAIILTELAAHRVKPEKSTVFKQRALNFWNLWP